jgi:hypothetical protein
MDKGGAAYPRSVDCHYPSRSRWFFSYMTIGYRIANKKKTALRIQTAQDNTMHIVIVCLCICVYVCTLK